MKRYSEMRTGFARCARQNRTTVPELVRLFDGAYQKGTLADIVKSTGASVMGGGRVNTEIFMTAMICDLAVIDGDAVHIFTPPVEFLDWAASCVKDYDPAYLASIHDMSRIDIDGVDTGIGVLHFPVGQGLVSVAFLISKNCVRSSGERLPDYGGLMLSFSTDTNEDLWYRCVTFDEQGIEAHRKDLPIVQRTVKYLLGLALYLSCFPEQVKPGIPDDCRLPQGVGPKRIHVGEAKEIVDRSGPCPHYRNGCFVILKSDKWVNKKGQVIFRHGCFVKGRAVTVEEPK